jgi:hypothetical protein
VTSVRLSISVSTLYRTYDTGLFYSRPPRIALVIIFIRSVLPAAGATCDGRNEEADAADTARDNDDAMDPAKNGIVHRDYYCCDVVRDQDDDDSDDYDDSDDDCVVATRSSNDDEASDVAAGVRGARIHGITFATTTKPTTTTTVASSFVVRVARRRRWRR